MPRGSWMKIENETKDRQWTLLIKYVYIIHFDYICRSMVTLPVTMSLMKISPEILSINYLLILRKGSGLLSSSPLRDRIFMGSILCRSCEFQRAVTVWYLEDSIPPVPLSLVLKFFGFLFCSAPWAFTRVINVPFIVEHSGHCFYQFDQLWVCAHPCPQQTESSLNNHRCQQQ